MSGSQTIFRQVALERLSTPEQLDQAMRVTSPLSWLMMGAVLVTVLAALVWSVVGAVPVKVSAQGILISPGGVLSIVSEHGGRIVSLTIKPGDTVAKGQLVARLEQPDLRQELETARQELAELDYQKAQIIQFQTRDMKVQLNLLTQKKADLQQQVRHAQERLRWLRERETNEAELLAKRIINRQRHIDTQIEINTALEQLSKIRNELKQVERDETSLTIGKERELLDKELAISAAQRKIESLVERLERQSQVISAYAGTVAESKVNVGEVVEKGAALVSLLPAQTAATPGGDLVAVVYVPPDDGKKVRVGMPAQVAPSTVKREEYGFIEGEVRSVAEIPSSSEGMMRILKNQQLVTSLSGGGAPFEVVIALKRDATTPSGYRWSSSRGPDAEVNTGTLAAADVTVREIHLISLAIPALEPLFDR